MNPSKTDKLLNEFHVRASRSSGKGGQNVNKVSTKVEVRFSIPDSETLSKEEKDKLTIRLKTKITENGDLIVTCQESRSQLQNRLDAEKKMLALIAKGLTDKKKRIPSKVPAAVIAKRLKDKRSVSEKKQLRSKNPDEI